MRKELLSEPKVIEEIAKDPGVDQAHQSFGPFANVVIPVVVMGGAAIVFAGCESGSVGPAASQTPRKCSEDPDKREYPCIGKLGEKIIGPMPEEEQKRWQDIQDQYARERAVIIEEFWQDWRSQLGDLSDTEKFTSWDDLLREQGASSSQIKPTAPPAVPPAPTVVSTVPPVIPPPTKAPPEKIVAVKPDQVATTRTDFAGWVHDSLRPLGSRGSVRAILPLEPGGDFSKISLRLEEIHLKVAKKVAGVSINLLDEQHTFVGVNGIPALTAVLSDAPLETKVYYKPAFMNNPGLQAVVFTEDGANYYAIIAKMALIVDPDTQLAIGVKFTGESLDSNILQQILASNQNFEVNLSGYSGTPYQAILLAFSENKGLGLHNVGF